MATIGMIAEFNPFHKGHKYIIDKAKSITGADNVIVVCSGNYVQRGEPSIFDKTVRTRAALSNGVDAVFELPVYYSTASAEAFARAGVKFLTDLGCVDYLCFGCETDNIKILPTIASVLNHEPEEYKVLLKSHLAEGESFPKARSNALQKYLKDTKNINEDETELTLKSPNNILAIEYMKAIKYFNSSLKPLAIRRVGADHSSTDITFDYVSAAAIRSELEKKHSIKSLVPAAAYKYYDGPKPLFLSDFDQLLGKALLSSKDYSEYLGVGEELGNRIFNQKNDYTDIENFIKQIDSKNNTRTAISRVLLHIMLNIKKDDVKEAINNNYFTSARLLGINRASNLISIINDNSKIPLISKYSTHYRNATGLDKDLLDIQLYADDLYRLVYMTKYKEVIPNEFERQIIVK
ncbi:MAG: nucleotidyltransferase family protein [Eubacterium sp.]|nr:nucleotidyltransferase family protein [Eubacterium sp.]